MEDTPESLGMISGDIIDVYKEQLGGYNDTMTEDRVKPFDAYVKDMLLSY